jgi:hypothetical protein
MKGITQQYVGTTEEWENENPVLFEGVWGVEVAEDGKRFLKIGVGERWNATPYVLDPHPGNNIPLMDGEGSVGESLNYSASDHRHPSDTSRLALVSENTQIVDSDVALAMGKKLLGVKADGSQANLVSIGDYGTYEQIEVSTTSDPLCLNHNAKAPDGTVVGKNILVNYKDEGGVNQVDTVAYESDVQAEKSRAESAEGNKANIIKYPHINWNPADFNIPAGRTLRFDASKTPSISGTGLPTLALFSQVNGNPQAMFGFYSNDGGTTTYAGLFHVNEEETAFEPDIELYDGTQWLNNGDYILRYGISGDFNQSIGDSVSLSGFDLAADITVLDIPAKDLIDIKTEVDQKQNKLKAGKNIDISNADPLNPKITGTTVAPDVTLDNGLAADAKTTAAMIAEAVRSTHDRGTVIGAYAAAQVYKADTITINHAGAGYFVGDSLQFGLKYIDLLLVVTGVGGSGEITTFTVSSNGANNSDFADTDIALHGGAGSGATVDITTVQGAGTTLADVPNPQPNDKVRVAIDEIHSNQAWDWSYADYNGDGVYNWVAYAPAGSSGSGDSSRDFFVDPIIAAELGVNAANDDKIGSRALTDEPESGTLITVTARKLTEWIQGIRNNLKYLLAHFIISSPAQGDIALRQDGTAFLNKPVDVTAQFKSAITLVAMTNINIISRVYRYGYNLVINMSGNNPQTAAIPSGSIIFTIPQDSPLCPFDMDNNIVAFVPNNMGSIISMPNGEFTYWGNNLATGANFSTHIQYFCKG